MENMFSHVFFPIRFPFNINTPIGYFVAGAILICVFVVICHCSISTLAQLIGFFGLLIAFGVTLQNRLNNLKENYKNDKNDVKIKLDLCDAIRFHSDVKELSNNSNYFAFHILFL